MHNRALHSKQQRARSCFNREIWGLRNLICTLHSEQCAACTIETSDWFSIVAKSLWMIVKEGRVYCILSKADLQTYWLGWPLPRSFLLCKIPDNRPWDRDVSRSAEISRFDANKERPAVVPPNSAAFYCISRSLHSCPISWGWGRMDLFSTATPHPPPPAPTPIQPELRWMCVPSLIGAITPLPTDRCVPRTCEHIASHFMSQ